MRKYTLFAFTAGDYKAVERYLNRQAQKGWELEKAGLFLARWKRSERSDLRWCLDLAKPKEEREDRKDYADFCAQCGWELAALRDQVYYFKSIPGFDAPPIQTDLELEKKRYNLYYMRSTILSAICILAMIAVYLLLFAASGHGLDDAVQAILLEWHKHWLAVGFMAGAPLWALWALWRVADFLRAMVSNRGGVIGVPPPWVMWANCVVSVAAGTGTVLFFAGLFLETVLMAELYVQFFVLVALWAVVLLYRSFSYEFSLFPGERRRTCVFGVACLAVFVLLVVGRIILPYGEWSTSPFSSGEPTEEAYALLADAPVVRGEDLGLYPEKENDYLRVNYERTPMGVRWEVENYHWDLARTQSGCETLSCPTVGLAKLAEGQFLKEIAWWSEDANRENKASYEIFSAPPKVTLEKISLDWADAAWYGENEIASVLVVRIGKQVSSITAPMHLTGELLAAMESRLAG